MKHIYLLLLVCLVPTMLWCENTLVGRVTDTYGNPIPYTTVYPEDVPVVGTATNNDGLFTISLDSEPFSGPLIVSYIGYEKQLVPLSTFVGDDTIHITLSEQPIALEQMVVTAPETKRKNRKKKLANLLYTVYTKMVSDLDVPATRYDIVSDVRINSENRPWGMEQMLGTIVTLPNARSDGEDSMQFRANSCKRFFQETIRKRADNLLTQDFVTDEARDVVSTIDSGVIVHKAIFAIGNPTIFFERNMEDLKHWRVSNESEDQLVLTYTQKRNFLGIFAYELKFNYIVDADDYTLHRSSINGKVRVKIPFGGMKIQGNMLLFLNLLNMSDEQIEKFKLKRANASLIQNVIYEKIDNHLYPREQNITLDAFIAGGRKDVDIPINVQGSQRMNKIQTRNVVPMRPDEIREKIGRTIVPIY